MWQTKPLLLLILLLLQSWLPAAAAENAIHHLSIRGAIGPASADYLIRGIESAQQQGASAVLLSIDTPGGLDRAMREMIKAVLASAIPVICYVEPAGARAASAGTYLLYACHIAAMTPATHLGAATPVQIGISPPPTKPGEEDKSGMPADSASAMQRKIINDAIAYIEGLAELRGRNKEWAAKAVLEGDSISANQALSLGVIDLIADSVADLLQQLDGREVSWEGHTVTLNTQTAQLITAEPDWRSEFLSVITDPNVAYILMLVGIYGLIFEFSNPGMGVPGIAGLICLLLALYAFQVLPVSYTGAALLLLGVGLMIAEALSPSFGILGAGGLVAFIFGSIMLFDSELPQFQLAIPVVLAVATVSGGLLILLLGMLIRSRNQQLVSGIDRFIGSSCRVEMQQGIPMVRLEGELWQVKSEQPLSAGDRVAIQGVTSLFLRVSRDTDNEE